MTAKPTIYVEATALTRKNKTGVDYYAQGLLQALVDTMPNYQFEFFFFSDADMPCAVWGQNVRVHLINKISGRLYRRLLYFGIAPPVDWLLRKAIDGVVIFPNFYRFPLKNTETLSYSVVHDTAYIDTPEFVPPRTRQLLRRLVPVTVRKSTAIVVNSHSTGRCLQHHYNLDAHKILVAYPGLTVHKIDNHESLLGLPKDYLLYLGTLEPRKNIANLIRAHRALPEQLRRRYKLVLAGGKGWMDQEIQNEIVRSGSDVIQLGYVSDEDKAALYTGASVFIYPAYFEGFGMPVLEAQYFGVPVITTRSSSLPEAAGKSAVYVRPTAAGIKQGVVKLLSDRNLRARLKKEGKIHANRFTWEKSAMILRDRIIEDSDN